MTSQMKRYTGQGLEGSRVKKLLSQWSWDVSAFQHLRVLTNPEALRSLSLWFLWRFHDIDMVE